MKLDDKTIQTIEAIIQKGSSAEIKVCRDRVVVWEVQSKKKIETPVTKR